MVASIEARRPPVHGRTLKRVPERTSSTAPVASSVNAHESPRSVNRLSSERTTAEGSTTSRSAPRTFVSATAAAAGVEVEIGTRIAAGAADAGVSGAADANATRGRSPARRGSGSTTTPASVRPLDRSPRLAARPSRRCCGSRLPGGAGTWTGWRCVTGHLACLAGLLGGVGLSGPSARTCRSAAISPAPAASVSPTLSSSNFLGGRTGISDASGGGALSGVVGSGTPGGVFRSASDDAAAGAAC